MSRNPGCLAGRQCQRRGEEGEQVGWCRSEGGVLGAAGRGGVNVWGVGGGWWGGHRGEGGGRKQA
eukprot:14560377-Heterocapsa_arctica.AAC.1